MDTSKARSKHVPIIVTELGSPYHATEPSRISGIPYCLDVLGQMASSMGDFEEAKRVLTTELYDFAFKYNSKFPLKVIGDSKYLRNYRLQQDARRYATTSIIENRPLNVGIAAFLAAKIRYPFIHGSGFDFTNNFTRYFPVNDYTSFLERANDAHSEQRIASILSGSSGRDRHRQISELELRIRTAKVELESKFQRGLPWHKNYLVGSSLVFKIGENGLPEFYLRQRNPSSKYFPMCFSLPGGKADTAFEPTGIDEALEEMQGLGDQIVTAYPLAMLNEYQIDSRSFFDGSFTMESVINLIWTIQLSPDAEDLFYSGDDQPYVWEKFTVSEILAKRMLITPATTVALAEFTHSLSEDNQGGGYSKENEVFAYGI